MKPEKITPTTPDQRGQGMVEFSLILLVLLGIFIGAFEIMVLFNKWNDLESATRMATRQAAESWVPNNTPPDIEGDITTYLHNEMIKMGYPSSQITNTVTVEVIAHEYVSGSLDPDTSSKVCTYGEYISVKSEMDYSPVIIPINVFFDTGPDGTGSLSAQYINRCTRGQ
ncbi:MAG: TadE/TadG family type IV pilus assembly protein [Chloroflexota bacterium]